MISVKGETKPASVAFLALGFAFAGLTEAQLPAMGAEQGRAGSAEAGPRAGPHGGRGRGHDAGACVPALIES